MNDFAREIGGDCAKFIVDRSGYGSCGLPLDVEDKPSFVV